MDAALAAAGIERTGDIEQPRVRPWATVLTARTSAGPVWLKATAPATAHEVAIYAVLAEVAPGHVLAPIALDHERGWLLLPDGGPAMRAGADGDRLVAGLARAMAAYADLQRAVAPRVGDLLAAGVPDMRPAAMPARFDEALAAAAGAPAELHDRVAAMRATYAGWCEALAAAPGGASLDHNDLHPGNVLDGGRRFYDWGDSVVAHPFSCLLMPLGYVHGRLGRDMAPVLDAYLAAFADLAPRAELERTVRLAAQVAKVARALTWERALRALDPDDPEAARFAGAPFHALAAIFDGPFDRVV